VVAAEVVREEILMIMQVTLAETAITVEGTGVTAAGVRRQIPFDVWSFQWARTV
jgi:hypothetical protein